MTKPEPNLNTPKPKEASGSLSYSDRVKVSPDYQNWSVDYPDYNPVDYTDEFVSVHGVEQGWADPADVTEVDFSTRFSHTGEIQFDESGRPLNPAGRTGLRGRGKLGKWGANHAADPIVFSKNTRGELQILLIKRKDTGDWALPGGMVDPGEKFSQTALRELREEAGVNLENLEVQEVFSGVVDDPRNTDNAWMETVAVYVEIPNPVEPRAGDDADEAEWKIITPDLLSGLYASHGPILQAALDKRQRAKELE